jgi:NRAMP (natural resistance-associated macrophage protein)-like metal ion transporter
MSIVRPSLVCAAGCADVCTDPELHRESAVLDDAHVGDIRGALGTIRRHDLGPRRGWSTRLKTLLAILGPGLIVMVGDNDAGAFGTYAQAGQDYGTALLWTLLLLIPVLYVNQEMVLRLGTVTGVGHARLILERFGKFWGAFSVIDLFLLNALTLVTEFIGISLALDYLGLPRQIGVLAAAGIIIAAAGTGSFRRFERLALLLVLGSLLLVPILLWAHPPAAQLARDFVVPHLPQGAHMNEVMLLVIAIVGTTVAPWQLFFQQSYVIDKRITPRFMRYERADLCLGIALAIVGGVAMIAFSAATFAGHAEFSHFQDAAGVAAGLHKYVGPVAGVFFAVALIDASVIGAMAVSVSTAYALGDVLSLRHSLHRKPTEAKAFYAVYAGLVLVAAALVLTPGTPLGLLTNTVQTLAGVLLPSATVFLLLLCNDRTVLGPWVNGRWVNLFTAAIIGVLVLLSLILSASVLYPQLSAHAMRVVLEAGALGLSAAGALFLLRADRRAPIDRSGQATWRMPPLRTLAPARMSPATRLGMLALRGYLLLAGGLILVRIVQLASSHIG